MKSQHLLLAALCSWPFSPKIQAAETSELTITMQYGLSYLPLMILEEKALVEAQAKKAGLGPIKTHYARLAGAGLVNDSLVSGSAQFGAIGVPSMLTLWEKTRSSLKMKTIGALCSMPMYLNTVDPKIKTLADFTDQHKIALPTTKVSVQAVTLQMAAAKAFGQEAFERLDKYTVSMSHPDGMTALLAGKGVVAAHFTSPPFQYDELKDKRVHRVLSSYDILGGPSTFVLVVASESFQSKNPKLFAAFVAAYEEAQEFVKAHKAEAAAIYLKIAQSKEKAEDIVTLLNNPEIEFSMTPKNTMKYADFMLQVKTIKSKPSSWKEYAFSHLHERHGS